MHRGFNVPDACVRACEQVSSRLDSELSEFEQASLQAHLRQCVECLAVADGFATVTWALRSAPVEAPSFACWLPRARRPRTYAPRAASVAAALAVVALGGLVSLHGSVSPTAGVDVRAHELMGVKERILEQRAVVDRPKRPRRGVMAAEGTTLNPAPTPDSTTPRDDELRLPGRSAQAGS